MNYKKSPVIRALLVAAFVVAFVMPVVRAGGADVPQTTNTINDCVKRSNSFKKTFDKALAEPNVRAGKQNEADLNQSAANLASQMDKVGDSWNKGHNMSATRSYVSGAVSQANNVSRAMNMWHMGNDCESQWAALRGELNRLASTFGVAGVR